MEASQCLEGESRDAPLEPHLRMWRTTMPIVASSNESIILTCFMKSVVG